MKFIDAINPKNWKFVPAAKISSTRKRKPLNIFTQRSGIFKNLFVYNGEKNLGELGPNKDYVLDYGSLRSRGHQLFLENKVVQIILKRKIAWVIGNGLDLECEPNEVILKAAGIKFDFKEFSNAVEARISIWKNSKMSTWAGNKSLSELEKDAFQAGFNGGSNLVVLRVVNGIVKYELIDGVHLRAPMNGTDFSPLKLQNGNYLMNGIEFNDKGEHVAFHVQKSDFTFERILAKSPSTGLTMAFLDGGDQYRIDNSIKIPKLAGLFETLNGMDKYETATIGMAEEQNRIAYQAVYKLGADTSNPMIRDLADALDEFGPDGTIPVDQELNVMANKVQVSTNKQTFAMPEGSEIKPLGKNEGELYFKDFFTVVFNFTCAAANIPPRVALTMFDASYSSARAEVKDFEHTLLIERKERGNGFLQPGYELQLHLDIVTGKIQAPGYLQAFLRKDEITLAAYRRSRWVGDNLPHIDPEKEANAERIKLGKAFEHVPLTTPQKSTSVLNGGDFALNVRDSEEALEMTESMKPAEEKPSPGRPEGS